jgi:hypothetical protein
MAIDAWVFFGGLSLGALPLLVWWLNRRRKWLGWLLLALLIAAVAVANLYNFGRLIP